MLFRSKVREIWKHKEREINVVGMIGKRGEGGKADKTFTYKKGEKRREREKPAWPTPLWVWSGRP